MKFILFTLFLYFSLVCVAQGLTRSVIGGIGNSTQNNELLIQSTVGQPSITGTEKSSNGLILRQGFHQSYSVISEGNHGLVITLFPNPNTGFFHFYTDLDPDSSFIYYINDSRGRKVQTGSAKGNEHVQIDIIQLASGIYFLNIETNKGTGYFKISKTL